MAERRKKIPHPVPPFPEARALLIVLLLGAEAGGEGPGLTIINNCLTTIWPGITPGNSFNGGGFPLKPGSRWCSRRRWGGRDASGANRVRLRPERNGSCQTGACGSVLKCSASGQTPATWPSSPRPLGLLRPPPAATATCATTAPRSWPSRLTARRVACRSACDVFNTDQYCCRGVFGNSAVCQPTYYSKIFKQACPGAYSYAYDDPTSIFTCVGGDYIVSFCTKRALPLVINCCHLQPEAEGVHLPHQQADMQRITRTSIADGELAGCAALRLGEHVVVIVAVTPLHSFRSYLWEKLTVSYVISIFSASYLPATTDSIAQALEAKDASESISMLYRVLENPSASPEALRIKEQAISNLTELLTQEKKAEDLRSLLTQLRPFFSLIPKAKTAKIVRGIIDAVAKIPGTSDLQISLCKEMVEWTRAEKRTFLRQRVEARLAALLMENKEYSEALTLLSSLIKEVRRLDDKLLLVDIDLLESKLHFSLRNLPKAKAALTAARTAANAIYVPPAQQGTIDLQSGILHAEEKDYKTAYSYFFEAFEAFNALEDPRAVFSLKYMLLCKIMVSQADDVSGIISSKAGLQYVGPDLDAMKAVADAHSKRSLKFFETAGITGPSWRKIRSFTGICRRCTTPSWSRTFAG
ncbi:26S proteasome non-atpase regulatory subunit [Musa troglodytarum]|uniref:26S proteasome non-atpase regulatory subunit n=1 Tax=Musa troglodytarum TaxID=320322 RepID=A0A9E7HIF1_9LILI|nr:26S proteasome non-atpase regulatory subunit [Musa troglodytarum]